MTTHSERFDESSIISQPVGKISPIGSVLLLAWVIFMAELASMFVLYLLDIPNYFLFSLLDGLIMVTLILPGLYFLQLNPLQKQIEERIQVERSLRSSEELLKKVVELLPVGVRIVDKNSRDTLDNPAMHKIWASSEQDAPRAARVQNGWRVDTGERIDPDEWATSRAIKLGETTLNQELEIEAFDGSHKIILNSTVPILDERVEIRGAVVVQHDITERKLSAEKLERQNEQLRELYQAESTARQFAETLSAAAQALTQVLELDYVIETLLDHLHRVVPSNTAGVTLLEAEEYPTIHSQRGYGAWEKRGDIPSIPYDGMTDSILRRLNLSRKSLVLPNLATPSDQPNKKGAEQIRSWLVVPIIASDKVIGWVELGSVEAKGFNQGDARWAEALVVQAAVALQNAWLFEQVRSSSERLQSLAHKLVKVQENERTHIARELHDDAGQVLSSLKLSLGRLEQDPDCTQRMRRQLEELKQVADGVLENLHRMAMDLRPVTLDRLGLVAALEQYVNNLNSEELSIHFKTIGFEGYRLNVEAEASLYRIGQEAINNAVCHAQASSVGVLLERRGDEVKLFVEDDGVGFSPESVDQKDRLGLVGMRERAEMLGGKLTIESAEGQGTAVIVEVPDVNTNPSGG